MNAEPRIHEQRWNAIHAPFPAECSQFSSRKPMEREDDALNEVTSGLSAAFSDAVVCDSTIFAAAMPKQADRSLKEIGISWL
jgi:hypothetical protein